MTKKDYELIASVICRANFDSFTDKATFILDLGNTLAEDNPKFDMTKWADACLGERIYLDNLV